MIRLMPLLLVTVSSAFNKEGLTLSVFESIVANPDQFLHSHVVNFTVALKNDKL